MQQYEYHTGVYSPFIEGGGSFILHHVESTVDGAAVVVGTGIHEACFNDVHRRRHNRGTEACAEGSGEMARQVVWKGPKAISLHRIWMGVGGKNSTRTFKALNAESTCFVSKPQNVISRNIC